MRGIHATALCCGVRVCVCVRARMCACACVRVCVHVAPEKANLCTRVKTMKVDRKLCVCQALTRIDYSMCCVSVWAHVYVYVYASDRKHDVYVLLNKCDKKYKNI